MQIGVLRPRTAAIYSVDSISDVVVGRENRDQPLDGGGNTLPIGLNVVMGMIGNNQMLTNLA